MSYVEAQPLSGRARRRRVMRRRFLRRPAAVGSLVIVVLFVLAAVFARWVAPHPPGATDFDAILASPSREHLLGTDELGRDTLSRIIWGARASIQAGFFATVLAMAVAVPIGLIAGYYRGWLDTVIARVTDVLLAFPFLILAVALAAILGPSLLNATLALGIAAIPPLIRIARRSEEHTSEFQSRQYLVCRLLLEKKKQKIYLFFKKKKIKTLTLTLIKLMPSMSEYVSKHVYIVCCCIISMLSLYSFFFFNDTATTEIYTLSLHDALPIYHPDGRFGRQAPEAVEVDRADQW